MDFAHVPVMHGGHLPIVPGDRDRIPTCLGDNADISGIASPIDAGALFEVLGFGDCHHCSFVTCGWDGENSPGISSRYEARKSNLVRVGVGVGERPYRAGQRSAALHAAMSDILMVV
jgi:hypothetical protein